MENEEKSEYLKERAASPPLELDALGEYDEMNKNFVRTVSPIIKKLNRRLREYAERMDNSPSRF